AVERILTDPGGETVGCVIVEPVQGRGGDVVPPPGFLAGLARICRERDLVLVFDEIYTGLGRTGRMFAFEHEEVVPDVICIGKALSGALPIAACLGSAQVMEAWPASSGEAKHTSTFLGNPLACAAAIASLGEIERLHLPARAEEMGEYLRGLLDSLAGRQSRIGEIRGRGLMIGIDLVLDRGSTDPDPTLAERLTLSALRQGWILLPGGPHGNVISLSPPLTISRDLLRLAVRMLDETLEELTS
ncbi:MAG: aminotransferase class III-fold pyridoxal phosphate-dependent enzyme, partial [marine benthic group bacterium]|nr:aminotransferase class III-fold pyridoxal phosphate-dependent enzyme [Gemmatimonadota bacterium]